MLQVKKGTKQSKDMKIDSYRKNKLFHREEMKPLSRNDFLKIIIMSGIIIVPLVVGLVV